MKGTQGYFLVAGLGLIALVNAIVLLGVAWNRQEPAESRLQLSERELLSHYGYARKENSGIGLRLDYRWPSAEDDEGFYPSISLEKMLELGFQQPAGPDDDSLRRYSRQQQREALLVLELDGPAYQREVQLARDRYTEAQRLQRLDPGNRALADEARQAASSLDSQQQRISRLMVVDLGLDRQTLRARYPDRQRYAIVRGHVRPFAHRQWLPWRGSPCWRARARSLSISRVVTSTARPGGAWWNTSCRSSSAATHTSVLRRGSGMSCSVRPLARADARHSAGVSMSAGMCSIRQP